jgi:hypothetical protein
MDVILHALMSPALMSPALMSCVIMSHSYMNKHGPERQKDGWKRLERLECPSTHFKNNIKILLIIILLKIKVNFGLEMIKS